MYVYVAFLLLNFAVKGGITRIMIMIAYCFGVEDGVGAKRSRFLYNMLKSRGISINVVDKEAFASKFCKNRLFWLLKCMLFLLKSKKQVVYISCGPFWHLLFVSLTSFLKGHRLFVDFRDPWSLNVKKEPVSWKRFMRWNIAICIEKMAYSIAEKFIVCTPGMLYQYMDIFSDDTKLFLALNGHEVDNNFLKSVKRKTIPYKIVCLGKFLSYGERYLTEYEQLCDKLHDLNADYKIFFIGADAETCSKFSNDAHVNLLPKMSYKEAINFVSDAQMAILSIRDEDFDFGTKVFDYIALGITMYDCFDHKKTFYNFFKAYIFKNLSNIPDVMPDIEGKFYRGNCLRELCNVLQTRDGE